MKDLNELSAFLKLCRKQGVSKITWEGTSVELGALPPKSRKEEDASDEIPTEALTPEQLMFYSAVAEQ